MIKEESGGMSEKSIVFNLLVLGFLFGVWQKSVCAGLFIYYLGIVILEWIGQ